MEMYTVDPSGGWRSWTGSGTAVGRGAEGVRWYLRRGTRDDPGRTTTTGGSHESTTAVEVPRGGWRGALDGAMMASIVALDRDGDSTDNADLCDGSDAKRAVNYGAVVIFG